MLEEPPTNDRIHVEVVSTSKRMGLLYPKVNTRFIKLSQLFWIISKTCVIKFRQHSLFILGIRILNYLEQLLQSHNANGINSPAFLFPNSISFHHAIITQYNWTCIKFKMLQMLVQNCRLSSHNFFYFMVVGYSGICGYIPCRCDQQQENQREVPPY